jgi:hypothetical protein
LIPNARIICILRDPVGRAISHWRHERRHGVEKLQFEAAIEAEAIRTDMEWEQLVSDPTYSSHNVRSFSYFRRGVYEPQLALWIDRFQDRSILILDAADLFDQPSHTTARVCEFLGIPAPNTQAAYPAKNQGLDLPVSRSAIEDLAQRFRPHNEQLFEYLDRDFDWSGMK